MPAQAPAVVGPPRSRWAVVQPWLAVGVLVAGLGVTLLAWQQARRTARREVEAYFAFRARDALSRMGSRLRTYEEVLRGGRGLYAASQDVSRSEFATYVATLQLGETYPGIQGVGFAMRIPASGLAAHEAAMRREGLPDYRVRPPGPREPMTSIIYLEPSGGRNQRAFGFDMHSEPVRREAMDRAWLKDETALSGRVVLVQETGHDVQQGFLMYLPVYRNGADLRSEAARRAALRGWVYAPFRMNDFMQGVLGEQAEDLDIEIYDSLSTAVEDRMYDRRPATRALAPGFSATHVLAFGGHAWTVAFRALPSLETRIRQDASPRVLAVGLAGTLLLASLVWMQSLSRDRALALAESHRYQMEAERLHHQEAIGVMAKGLAHDFNNLLQSMVGWVEVARLRAGQGTPVWEALSHIDAGSTLARDLSDRLRLLGDTRDQMDTEGPVRPVVRESVALALAGSAVAVRYDLPEEEVRIRYNRDHLRSAFGHLATNAREAMGGRGTLSISGRRIYLKEGNPQGLERGAYLHLAFQDTGPGIPSELLGLIFDPYFSTKESFSQKGLGLGLALCRIIFHHHGGAISAHSEAGQGAAFHVYLPVAQVS